MPSNPADPTSATGAAPDAGTPRRYGNKPVIFIVGVAVAAVFTVGWAVALGSYNGSFGQVSFQTLSWTVDSGSAATIKYQVNGRTPSQCLVIATDSRQVEVGQVTAEVEPGLRNVTTEVETVRRAAAVEVASCREQVSRSD